MRDARYHFEVGQREIIYYRGIPIDWVFDVCSVLRQYSVVISVQVQIPKPQALRTKEERKHISYFICIFFASPREKLITMHSWSDSYESRPSSPCFEYLSTYILHNKYQIFTSINIHFSIFNYLGTDIKKSAKRKIYIIQYIQHWKYTIYKYGIIHIHIAYAICNMQYAVFCYHI